MDMADIYGSSAQYLKAEDLKGRAHTVEVRAVERRAFKDDNGGQDKEKAILWLNSGNGAPVDKALVLNVTNARTVANAFGDTAIDRTWVCQRIEIFEREYPGFGAGIAVRIPADPAAPSPALGAAPAAGVQAAEEPPF